MSFGQAFVTFWKNYFNFRGKATRSEFWYTALWIVLVMFTLYVTFPLLTQFFRRARDAGFSKSFMVFFILTDFLIEVVTYMPKFEDSIVLAVVLILYLIVVIFVGVKPSRTTE
ncbi:DUF805 domain-containing protein [Listeria kieliensis]|uniref:DUF805 domain-containing protein n=1 Tax=Listeria kieliensis TaxID=1621700 RepID=UPI000E212844|nr:hypothetical protein [Listeria kieliensis]